MQNKISTESNQQSVNNQIHVVQDVNFLIQTCSLCNTEMNLVEGATIYGAKWYHKECWQSMIKRGECKQ
jgi:hypothetical protein